MVWKREKEEERSYGQQLDERIDEKSVCGGEAAEKEPGRVSDGKEKIRGERKGMDEGMELAEDENQRGGIGGEELLCQ